ncbi:hypothetical protein [Streptomyces chartreusis]|uniref:hypothetical protein n=1 Tax=Streptomyces chartreusis TaxID=1969 RepID=UPI0037B5D8DB
METYRHCAQWITAAAAVVAAAFVAGLQLTALRDLVWWKTILGVLAAAGVVVCAGWVIQRAARVMAPFRPTMAELADADLKIAQGKTSATDVKPEVKALVEGPIEKNKGLLFPPGVHTISDLYHLACGRRRRGRRGPHPDQQTAHEYSLRLVHFVEMCEIRKRYDDLLRSLLRVGLVGLAAVTLFVLASRAEPAALNVTTPLPVQVIFTSKEKALIAEKWPPGCTSVTSRGSAIGGSAAEPEVVVASSSAGCPQHRGTVKRDVGVVLYLK